MIPSRKRILAYGGAILLLLCPALLFLANSKKHGSERELSGLDTAVLRISAPLQSGVSWIINGLGGVWNGYVWLVDVEEENHELRAKNAKLQQELGQLRSRDAEISALEEMLTLKRDLRADTVGARVIAASLDERFRVLRLSVDRGDAALGQWLPVLSADGLVGRIHKVYGDYAEVLLLSDTKSAVDVVIDRTMGRGVLRGAASESLYRCTIDYLSQDEPVEVGDEVFTSGLGGDFPKGLLVGKIVSVEKAEYGLHQKVSVAPAVNFSALRTVQVLLAPPPPPDPDAGRAQVSPSASKVRPF